MSEVGNLALQNRYVDLSKVLAAPAENTSTVSTADYVIAFARARSAHINSWLQRQLQTMREAGEQTQVLNEVLAVFSEYADGFGGEKGDAVAHGKCKKALTDAIEQLPADSPLCAKLTSLRDDPKSLLNQKDKGGTDTIVLKQEMGAMIRDLENELKKADRRSQDVQLLVNQKLGEKQEIMQLAAMLIQQFNETAKAILQRS